MRDAVSGLIERVGEALYQGDVEGALELVERAGARVQGTRLGGAGRDNTDASFAVLLTIAATYPVCEVSPQLAAATGASCGTSMDAGWCYVDSAPAKGDCARGVRFGARATFPLMGAIATLLCDPPQ